MTDVFQHFKSHVESHLQEGSDLKGSPAKYICADSIENYWTEDKIIRILQEHLGETAERITRIILQKEYTMVFSILVYSSSLRNSYIDEIMRFLREKIDDKHIPLTKKPDSVEMGTWTLFDRYQWTFCPLRLGFTEYDRSQDLLNIRYVFPGVEIAPEKLGRPPHSRAGKNDAGFRYMRLGRDPKGAVENDQSVR